MFIFKVFQNPTDTQPIKQIQNIKSASIDKDITNFDVLNIELPIEDGYIEHQKVQLTQTDNGGDIILFEGFITPPVGPNLTSLSLVCRSYKAWMIEKKVHSQKNYNTDILTILNDLINESNARTNGDKIENWTVSTTRTDIIEKKYNIGDTYFDIIDELAQYLQCQWDIRDGVLLFDDFIGENKTVLNYQEFVYNPNLKSTNIQSITPSGAKINTTIIGKDNSGIEIKSDPIAQQIYGFTESFETFREGDLGLQTQALLDEQKEKQLIYEIIPAKDENIDVEPGDIAKLIIENHSSYLNYNGEIRVLKKSSSIQNSQLIVNSYGLSTVNITPRGLTQITNKLQKDIKKLQLS